MVCIYSINSSGSCWLAKVLAAAVPDAGDRPVVVEPFSPAAWVGSPDPPTRYAQDWSQYPFAHLQEYWAIMVSGVHLAGRWEGHNEAVTEPDRATLHSMFDAFETQWPEAVGFKTLDFPYWGLMREHWPDMKFVRLDRDLEGWLCSLARRSGWWHQHAPYYYTRHLKGPVPWDVKADTALRDAELDPRFLPLLRAAYHRSARYTWYDRHGPVDALHTTFDKLLMSWDFEIPRALEHCGLPVPNERTLKEWAAPVARRWSGPDRPYTRGDVARVLEVLRERGDCVE